MRLVDAMRPAFQGRRGRHKRTWIIFKNYLKVLKIIDKIICIAPNK